MYCDIIQWFLIQKLPQWNVMSKGMDLPQPQQTLQTKIHEIHRIHYSSFHSPWTFGSNLNQLISRSTHCERIPSTNRCYILHHIYSIVELDLPPTFQKKLKLNDKSVSRAVRCKAEENSILIVIKYWCVAWVNKTYVPRVGKQ